MDLECGSKARRAITGSKTSITGWQLEDLLNWLPTPIAHPGDFNAECYRWPSILDQLRSLRLVNFVCGAPHLVGARHLVWLSGRRKVLPVLHVQHLALCLRPGSSPFERARGGRRPDVVALAYAEPLAASGLRCCLDRLRNANVARSRRIHT